MLSKCTNPDCSEIFVRLRDGKIFYLAPTPDVQIAMGMQHPALHERFWLCARCPKNEIRRRRPRTRAATAGREDR